MDNPHNSKKSERSSGFAAWKKTIRKGAFLYHLWIGLILGLYLSLIGLSGTVLVFLHDLEPIQWPEIHHVSPPSPEAKLLSLSSIYEAVRKAYPKLTAKEIASLDVPAQAGGAYQLHIGWTPNPVNVRLITIDPYTGGVIRDQMARESPLGFILAFHIYLLLGLPGMLVNGIGGLLAALLLITGVYLWWPSATAQIKSRFTIARGVSFRRRIHDLHNVTGVYSLPILIVIVLTGAMFPFYSQVSKAVYSLLGTPEDKPPPKAQPLSANAKTLPAETLAAIAERAASGGTIKSVTYPTQPDETFSAFGEWSDTGLAPYFQVNIDPYTGAVLRLESDTNAPLGGKVMRTLGLLHFGWWGGWITKILYALIGLAPGGLFATGVIKYVQLRQAKAANLTRLAQKKSPKRGVAPEGGVSETASSAPSSS